VSQNYQGRIQGDGNLIYGSIHPFPIPGWTPSQMVRIRGRNWQIIFKSDGANYLEMERGGKIVDRSLDGPNVFIGAAEGLSTAEETTRIQRPMVDVIRGLLLLHGHHNTPILLPPVWEGVLRKTGPHSTGYEVGRREIAAHGITTAQLEDWGRAWDDFDPTTCRKEVGFALRWYYKGMINLGLLEEDNIDSFVSLWISIITLVRAWHAREIGGDLSEMQRFIPFAKTQLDLSAEGFSAAKESFDIVSKRRNELFKGGGGMVIQQNEMGAILELAQLVLNCEVLKS